MPTQHNYKHYTYHRTNAVTTKTTNSRTVKSRYIAFNTNPIYLPFEQDSYRTANIICPSVRSLFRDTFYWMEFANRSGVELNHWTTKCIDFGTDYRRTIVQNTYLRNVAFKLLHSRTGCLRFHPSARVPAERCSGTEGEHCTVHTTVLVTKEGGW